MASFNLGCITGKKGDTGPKGDKGEKGDKGDRGERGTDGLTPVFGISNVHTVDSSVDASVEIDSEDPSRPCLTFYIPKGKDGNDASGDMESSVYDQEGRKEDVYSYSQKLFEGALKKTGGQLTGQLVASEGVLTERCVRNIIYASELPLYAAEGDLCFVLVEKEGDRLADCDIGSVLLLEESGEKVPYIVVAKDYYKNGTVTLVRKNLVKDDTMCFDYHVRDSYSCSDIDLYLESVFVRNFSDSIQKNLVPVKLNLIGVRHCFLPSRTDFENMEYFKNSGITAASDNVSTAERYMMSDVNSRKQISVVDEKGNYAIAYQYNKMKYRPMINLSADFKVANCIYESQTVMESVTDLQKIHLYTGGKWKEIDF